MWNEKGWDKVIEDESSVWHFGEWEQICLAWWPFRFVLHSRLNLVPCRTNSCYML